MTINYFKITDKEKNEERNYFFLKNLCREEGLNYTTARRWINEKDKPYFFEFKKVEKASITFGDERKQFILKK